MPPIQRRNHRSSTGRSVSRRKFNSHRNYRRKSKSHRNSRRKSKSRRNYRRKSKSHRNYRRKSKSHRNSRRKFNSRRNYRRNYRRKSKSHRKPMRSSSNHPHARRAPVVEDEEQGFTPIQPDMYVRIGENGIDRTGFGKWARVIEVTDDKALLKFKVGDIGDTFQYLEIDRDRCQLTTETQNDRKPNELNIPEGFTTDDERYYLTLNPTPADDLRREAEEDALYND